MRRTYRSLLSLLVLSLFISVSISAKGPSPISDLRISATNFNPALGDRVIIVLAAAAEGVLDVTLVDRDGFPNRTLTRNRAVKRGEKLTLEWDGKDDKGMVVPDEAWSLKIDLRSSGKTLSYFPADGPSNHDGGAAEYYDRQTGTLSYKLEKPARVHVQAGVARAAKPGQELEGAVLRTIVNRQPRAGGTVIEPWNGWDTTGSLFIPDLPDFVLAIATSDLPEHSIITTGNRKITFLQYATTRTGKSLFTWRPADKHHHQGLHTLEDVSPDMSLKVIDRRASKVRVALNLTGPSASAFIQQPGTILVFVDSKRVAEMPARKSTTMNIDVPLAISKGGAQQYITVNWVSEYGPVSVSSVLLPTKQTSGSTSSR